MKRKAREEITGRLPKSMAGLITASFALPDEFNPLRMRNEYSTEETALFKVNEEHKPNWSSADPNGQLPAETHMEFIFNDLLRNRISYERNPTPLTWSYNWMFGRNMNGTNETAESIFAGANSDPMAVTHATTVAAFKPHLDTYFACTDKNRAGMWVDGVAGALSSIEITLTPTPASTTGVLVLWYWNDGQWEQIQQTNITTAVGTYTFQVGTSAYYSVECLRPAAATSMAIRSFGNCGCWGHKYAPYALINASSIESCRMLGQSILVRNLSAPNYAAGNIVGVQPGKNRYWASFAANSSSTDPYPVLENYAGVGASRQLATGLYAFKKPTEEADLAFRNPFTIENVPGSLTTSWTSAQTPILNTEYIVVAMQCSTPDGRNILVRTVHAGEIETGNQFLMVAKPMAQPQDWRDGVEAMASMQQFYDNPVHWKRILSTIGSIASVGGRILSLFGPKGAAVGGIMSAGGSIISEAVQ